MSQAKQYIRGGVAVLLLAAAGCGEKAAEVQGRVTFQGKPLTFGMVTLAIKKPTAGPLSTNIRPDGTYSFPNIPTGETLIAVFSPDPKIPRETKEGKVLWPSDADRSLWFPIPDKYATPNTSGLEVTIAPGSNTHDIDLK